MIKIFFGSDIAIREQLTQQLISYSIDFQGYEEEELTEQVFLEILKLTSDFFDLLNPSLVQYKLDNRMSLKQFIQQILSDKDKYLRLPIVIVNDLVYSGISVEDIRMFIPKEYRKIERAYLVRKLEEIDTLTNLYYEIEEDEWRKVTLWIKANSEKFLIQAEINDYGN